MPSGASIPPAAPSSKIPFWTLRHHASLLALSGYVADHPILIVPGFMSTGLVCSEGRWDFKGQRVWLDLVKILQMTPWSANGDPKVRAFLAHLGLDSAQGLKDSVEGVKLEPLAGLGGVDFLSSTMLIEGSTYVFGPLLDSLRRVGYKDGVDLDAWPYDWRRFPSELKCATGLNECWFGSLLARLEKMRDDNGGRKPVLVAHSLGCRLTQYFSLWAEDNGFSERLGAAVEKVVALGGPFLGAAKGARGLITGDQMGLPFMSMEESVWLARHLASPPFLFPSLPSAWSTLAPHVFKPDGIEPAPCFLKLESFIDLSISGIAFNPAFQQTAEEPTSADQTTFELTWRGKTIYSAPLGIPALTSPDTLLLFPIPERFQLVCPNPFEPSDEKLRIEVRSAKRGTLCEGTANPLSDGPMELKDMQVGMSEAAKRKKEIEAPRKEARRAERERSKRDARMQAKFDKEAEWEAKEIEKLDEVLLKEGEAREKKYKDACAKILGKREEAEKRVPRELAELLERHERELEGCVGKEKVLAKVHAKHVHELAKFEDRAEKERGKLAKERTKADRAAVEEESKAAQRGEKLWANFEKRREEARAKLELEFGTEEALARIGSGTSEDDLEVSPPGYDVEDAQTSVEADTKYRPNSLSDVTAAASSGSLEESPLTPGVLREIALAAAPVVAHIHFSASFHPATEPKHSIRNPFDHAQLYVPTTTTDLLPLDGASNYISLVNQHYASDPLFGHAGKTIATRTPQALKNWHLVYGTGRRTEIGFAARRRTGRITNGPEGQAWNRFKPDWGLMGYLGEGIEAKGGLICETRDARQSVIVAPDSQGAWKGCGDGTVALVSLLHPITWRKHGVIVTTHELPGAEHRGMLGEERLHRHLIEICCRAESKREVALSHLEKARAGLKKVLGF